MSTVPVILHLDMDAFYASVEQAAKPSLRGKPVIVGGTGPRGVVATASYEARRFGVHSAMSSAEARRRCPNAAFLTPRFTLYRSVSDTVMDLLHRQSPLVEPLSLDEAYIDLSAGPLGPDLHLDDVRAVAEQLRAAIHTATGLTASVGAGTSKLVAKIASDAGKPDGLLVVEPGAERALLDPLAVRALPGVGPATGDALRRAGIHTVADLAATDEPDLLRMFGQAHGSALHRMAHGVDDRTVVAERDAKSISVEDTFDTDLVDRTRITDELDRLAERCVQRLRAAGRTGRTVVVKMRRYDFSTLTRSETLRAPTDEVALVRETARRLAAQVDVTGGLRLLGVGVSSLADFAQQDLFANTVIAATAAAVEPDPDSERPPPDPVAVVGKVGESGREATNTSSPQQATPPRDPDDGAWVGLGGTPVFHPGRPTGGTGAARVSWNPGQDVEHDTHGPGWVQGSGVGRVTVRFETPGSAPGRVRTFPVDDPALVAADPLPLAPAHQADAPGRGG